MRFGVCTSVGQAETIKAAGWDFLEENVQSFLRPESEGPWAFERAALPIEAANVLVPARLKITGDRADLGALRQHMERVTQRAGKAGIKTLVFGSGGARNVEDGVDRQRARQQILAFVRMAAELAKAHGVVLVAEPLQRGECNILNTVSEAMEYVRAVGHPNFQCLVDSYHFWAENEPLENLDAALPWIKHVHVADRGTRLAPGQTAENAAARQAEYITFFRALKKGGYDGRISVEGKWDPELAHDATAVLTRLKSWWAQA